MKLGEFVDRFKSAIGRRVIESYTPRYRPSQDQRPLPALVRRPIGGQADAIRGAALSLEVNRGTTVVGEMGTGKTFIAVAAAQMAGFRRVLVLCPPHLINKWQREVVATIPKVRAVIVKSITDLEALRTLGDDMPLYVVMSRERAKLSFRWVPCYVERWGRVGGTLIRRRPRADDLPEEEDDGPVSAPPRGLGFKWLCCPSCYKQVTDDHGTPISRGVLAMRRHTCNNCGGALWTAKIPGPRRFPLADYIKLRMGGFFQLLVADEVHEFKGRGSAQGLAAGVLADVCGQSLTLTGTLMGGCARRYLAV